MQGEGEKKKRRISADKLIALVVVFHCWMVLCFAGVLRSDSVRSIMLKHIYIGESIANPGQLVSCIPLVFNVKMKGKKERIERLVIAAVDSLRCVFVAIGLLLFTLFNVLGIDAPRFPGPEEKSGAIPSGMQAMLFPFGSTSGTDIDLFESITAGQQGEAMKVVKNDLSKMHPDLKDKKELHLWRVSSAQALADICIC
jgi:hypothetical protein